MINFKSTILFVWLFATQFILIGQVNEQNLLNEIAKLRAEENFSQAAGLLNKLAFNYWENEEYQKALQYFEQSVALNKEINNSNAIKAIYSNMGMIYSDLGQPETSIVFFRKSLLLSRTQNNKQDIGANLINIGVALKNLNRFQESVDNTEEALTIFKELGNKKLMRTCYGMLAEVYDELGESQKSMEYFNLYAAFQQQIQQEKLEAHSKEVKKEVAEIKRKEQKAIKEKVISEKKLGVTRDSLKISEKLSMLKTLEIQKQQVDLENQRLLTLIFIIGMGFVVIVALFILRSYQQKKKHNTVLEHRNEEIRKQNEEIKAKNHKINQSINYAKNIQGALLPDKERFDKLFKDSFIFFSPRDVVSGDFYWFNEIKIKSNNYKVVAAVDCTGHGVPGAFMSMLGISFLDEIVLDKGVVEPNEILENMHNMVKTSLKQDVSGNTDGMDMTICIIDEQKKELNFAGAVNPLVYIQNGEIAVLKGDFFGIGGQMKSASGVDRMYKNQTLDISKPTTCYIFSDGFSDQFGGEDGRKYFAKNFRNLLLSIYEKPMIEQHNILQNTLEEWHGTKNGRVDDVLVMGFRI